MPCRTTSSFLSVIFFRPAGTATATCRRKMALRFGGFLGSAIWWAVFVLGFQFSRHAGQPLDISSSIYSRSAMVVISFLSISNLLLVTSFLLCGLSRPSSFVTWYNSVKVLIFSVFITFSSRFSLCTSHLSWQGMMSVLTVDLGAVCKSCVV